MSSPDPHLLPDGSTSWGPDTVRNQPGHLRGRRTDAEARVAELEARWEKDNLCGICPYRESIQARVAELEAEVEKLQKGALYFAWQKAEAGIEKLRATNSEWQTGHRAMVKRAQKVEAEVEALREDYFKRLSGVHDAIEKAEAERDRTVDRFHEARAEVAKLRADRDGLQQELDELRAKP